MAAGRARQSASKGSGARRASIRHSRRGPRLPGHADTAGPRSGKRAPRRAAAKVRTLPIRTAVCARSITRPSIRRCRPSAMSFAVARVFASRANHRKRSIRIAFQPCASPSAASAPKPLSRRGGVTTGGGGGAGRPRHAQRAIPSTAPAARKPSRTISLAIVSAVMPIEVASAGSGTKGARPLRASCAARASRSTRSTRTACAPIRRNPDGVRVAPARTVARRGRVRGYRNRGPARNGNGPRASGRRQASTGADRTGRACRPRPRRGAAACGPPGRAGPAAALVRARRCRRFPRSPWRLRGVHRRRPAIRPRCRVRPAPACAARPVPTATSSAYPTPHRAVACRGSRASDRARGAAWRSTARAPHARRRSRASGSRLHAPSTEVRHPPPQRAQPRAARVRPPVAVRRRPAAGACRSARAAVATVKRNPSSRR